MALGSKNLGSKNVEKSFFLTPAWINLSSSRYCTIVKWEIWSLWNAEPLGGYFSPGAKTDLTWGQPTPHVLNLRLLEETRLQIFSTVWGYGLGLPLLDSDSNEENVTSLAVEAGQMRGCLANTPTPHAVVTHEFPRRQNIQSKPGGEKEIFWECIDFQMSRIKRGWLRVRRCNSARKQIAAPFVKAAGMICSFFVCLALQKRQWYFF